MYLKNHLLFIILLFSIFSFSGCGKVTVNEIPALVVIDTIPGRINKNIFEKDILKHKTIAKKEIDLLRLSYKIDKAGTEYVLSLKEKEKNKSRLLEIYRSINYAPLFSDTKGDKLVTLIPEWKEIISLSQPDNLKQIKTKDASGKAIMEKWCKIKTEGMEGYILSDYLLFKSFPEIEAVVIKRFSFISFPVVTSAKRLRECNRGMTVTLTGYEYKERVYNTKIYHMKVYEDYGWGVADNVLINAHIGVILPDKVTLYNAPEDRRENAVKDFVYTRMEAVPILGLTENDWYKVIYEDKNKIYYIRNGNDTISSKKDDLLYSSWVRDEFLKGKKILDEVFRTKYTATYYDTIAAVPDKQEKISQLENIYAYITEQNNKYPDSVFAGIGPNSLREFLKDIQLAKSELGNALSGDGGSGSGESGNGFSDDGTMPADENMNGENTEH